MDSVIICLCMLVVLMGVGIQGQQTTTSTSSSSSSSSPSSSSDSTSNSTSNTTSNSTASSSTEEPTQQNSNGHSSRLAQARLFHLWNLQRHVLHSLGWNSTPSSIDPETRERLIQGINPAAYVTQQKNCYYPLCDLPGVSLPDYINRSLWFDSCSRNVRFFFNIPSDEEDGPGISSATVKLHLKRRQDCSCTDDEEHTTSRVHIKIYQYRKPIRTQARLRHTNMRLIDAKMVTWDTPRWVSLQVTEAVRRIARGKRNGGFEIQIKNMEEEVLDARTIVDPTVCSPITEYECTDPVDPNSLPGLTDESDEENLSPVLEISKRITVTSQGIFDN